MRDDLPIHLRDEMDLSVNRLLGLVAHAPLGAPTGLDARLATLAEDFVLALHSGLRLARVEPLERGSLDRAAAHLSEALDACLQRDGAFRVELVADGLHVARAPLAMGRQPHVVGGLARELARHGCRGFLFHGPLGSPGMARLLRLLARTPERPEDAWPLLCQALTMESLSTVRALPTLEPAEERPAPWPARGLGRPRADLGLLLEGALEDLRLGRPPDMVALRHGVADLVDLLDAEAWEPGEDTLDDEAPGDPYLAHLVRVCELTILLGLGLHLGGAALQELGALALLHDGDALLLDPERPGEGALVELLLRERHPHPGRVRRLRALLDHPRDYAHAAGPGSLFGRVLRLADDYDNLVRSGGAAMSPAMALQVLQGGAGTRYDPELVQLLVNILGRYPPGTLLQLEDGRLVRVVGRCRSPNTFARPLCEVLGLAHGAEAPPGLQVDLALEGVVQGVVEAS